MDRDLAYNVRGASRLIEEETDEIWAILEEVVKDKLVLLNRAPTLHKLGIQAFQPVLIEGEAITIHPLVCRAFNADFDGDQMAVHIPLSTEAQNEAKNLMLSSLNLLKPATGTPIVSLHQDISLGCYWLTKIIEDLKGEGKIFGSVNETLLAYEFGEIDIKAKIKILEKVLNPGIFDNHIIETSLGRVIFNEALPEDYPFQNLEMKSKDVEKITADIIEKYPIEKIEETLDKIKNLGFEYSTISGISWGMDDLIVPPQKEKIIQEAEKEIEVIDSYYKKGLLSREEKGDKVIEVWSRVKSKIEELVPQTLPETGPVFSIVNSGAKGSWSQPIQMAGMKGLVINPAGKVIELPVKSSFKEGFNVLEYFISTHGARKGTADTALRTATAGYLTRRLVDVAHESIISQDDCKDDKGMEITRRNAEIIGQSLAEKIVGRTALEDIKGKLSKKIIVKKGEIIDFKNAEKIAAADIERVRVRSPLSCRTVRGICQKCYGWDLGKNQLAGLGEAVGIVAAQAIGEPGTQLTMRTFHTGGVAGGGDITFGLPRVQEIFEARVPGGKAEISKIDGKIIEITQDKLIRIKGKTTSSETKAKSKSKKTEIVEYKISPKVAIWVKVGEDIKRGQQLCEGNLDVKELFKLTDKDTAQQYIINEIQKIYTSQGANIHNKHIEVIVRQMFSRLRIKDSGSSIFTPGEVIERTKFLEENIGLKKENKKIAKATPILLGISRVALTTDSFLSAASFQETSRVLIRASIEGKEDKLRGLKENVIIGKLIPAGTGFKK